jgi:hypothetical protein
VIADLGLNLGRLCTPPNHRIGVGLGQGSAGGHQPPAPKAKTLFFGKLDFGSSGENIEGKGFILFLKTALNEEISICAAAAHVSAHVSAQFSVHSSSDIACT